MIDIVLLSPPSRSINHFRPPLSLIHVGGYLKSKGLDVKIVDVPFPQVIRNYNFWKQRENLIKEVRNETIAQIIDTKSKFIGISCYSPELEEVKDLIQMLKIYTDRKIIVGGIHPTLKPEDFKEADYVIQGIGEIQTYEAITGTHVLDRDFDSICTPDYSLVDMDYYTQPNPYAIRGVFISATYLLSGIGCPSSCTFCVAKTLRGHYGIGQKRSVDKLANQIKQLQERYKIDGFYFIDDLFTMDRQYVIEFCDKIRGSKLLWGCSSKVTTLTEGLISNMRDAGCVQIDFGVERGSDRSLKELKKGQTIHNIEQVFHLCKHYGIRTFANMLVNIPGETSQDLCDITKLLSNINPTVVSINIFEGYLGTELPDQKPSFGLICWTKRVGKRFNKISNNIKFYLTFKYWGMLWRSKRKLSYLIQLKSLIAELVNQKT